MMPAGIAAGLLGDDSDVELSVDLGMQADGNRVSSRGLDRMFQLYFAPVDHVSLAGERVGDVLRGNRAEELALVSGLARQGERHLSECGREPLNLGLLGLGSGCTDP